MLALGILAALALSTARRKLKFISGSAPLRAATAILLPSLVNTALRAASLAPFCRLIVLHLLCPDIIWFLLYQFAYQPSSQLWRRGLLVEVVLYLFLTPLSYHFYPLFWTTG